MNFIYSCNKFRIVIFQHCIEFYSLLSICLKIIQFRDFYYFFMNRRLLRMKIHKEQEAANLIYAHHLQEDKEENYIYKFPILRN